MNEKNKTPAKEKIRLPIGISSFKKLRENDYYYIDKTHFIRDVIEAPAEALLLPRPRRFGKTLNLSMLRYFFEKSEEDRSGLFDGLAIRNDKIFSEHQGRYPIIYLTFKDVKATSWNGCLKSLQAVIYEEYSRHRYLQDTQVLFSDEKTYFQKILDGELEEADFGRALKNLSAYLFRCYDEQAVILIDEYDTPLHAGYANGYYDEVVSFMRNFLSSGLKDNESLFKGVITGILRVAKESIFSGLNNLGVYTLLQEEFNTAFGFTKDEVKSLLNDCNIIERYDEVSLWYNGYLFNEEIIYNPWSVLNYMASKSRKPRPYWINTASTEIIDNLVTRGGRELREEIGQLLENKAITKPVYENIIMRDLEKRDDLLWSFLLFSGYLKTIGEAVHRNLYELKIPNEEVRIVYEELVKRWFAEKIESNRLEEMLTALESGDVKLFERMLRMIVLQIMSYHDLGSEPEKVYHALVLGMMVWLSGKYTIRSNRESGYGRYDLMLKPNDPAKFGIIIEFKCVYDSEKPEHVLSQALKQIEERRYAAELEEAGIKKVLKIAIAFRGKELWVKEG